MSGEATVSIPLSRPKVHRRPPFVAPRTSFYARSKAALFGFMFRRPLLFTCGAGVAMVFLALLMNGFVSLVAHHIDTLPMASMSPSAGKTTTLISAAEATLPVVKQNKTIIITDEKSTLVGQMAKMPENKNIGEIETMSDVDKDTGRELLSIVGKY